MLPGKAPLVLLTVLLNMASWQRDLMATMKKINNEEHLLASLFFRMKFRKEPEQNLKIYATIDTELQHR